MPPVIKRFLDDESGANALEYALICALIAVVIVATVKKIGTALNNTYANIYNTLK